MERCLAESLRSRGVLLYCRLFDDILAVCTSLKTAKDFVTGLGRAAAPHYAMEVEAISPLSVAFLDLEVFCSGLPMARLGPFWPTDLLSNLRLGMFPLQVIRLTSVRFTSRGLWLRLDACGLDRLAGRISENFGTSRFLVGGIFSWIGRFWRIVTVGFRGFLRFGGISPLKR